MQQHLLPANLIRLVSYRSFVASSSASFFSYLAFACSIFSSFNTLLIHIHLDIDNTKFHSFWLNFTFAAASAASAAVIVVEWDSVPAHSVPQHLNDFAAIILWIPLCLFSRFSVHFFSDYSFNSNLRSLFVFPHFFRVCVVFFSCTSFHYLHHLIALKICCWCFFLE